MYQSPQARNMADVQGIIIGDVKRKPPNETESHFLDCDGMLTYLNKEKKDWMNQTNIEWIGHPFNYLIIK